MSQILNAMLGSPAVRSALKGAAAAFVAALSAKVAADLYDSVKRRVNGVGPEESAAGKRVA